MASRDGIETEAATAKGDHPVKDQLEKLIYDLLVAKMKADELPEGLPRTALQTRLTGVIAFAEEIKRAL